MNSPTRDERLVNREKRKLPKRQSGRDPAKTAGIAETLKNRG